MKAIIYAGIGLFSVASVYGVADYYSSNKQGELKNLYAEETEPAANPDETNTVVIPVKETETSSPEKTRSAKKEKRASKKIKAEDYSRALIPEEEELKVVIEEPVKKVEEVIPEKKDPEPAESVSLKEENKRTITLEKFSRAPLKKQVRSAKKVAVKTKG